MSRDVPVSQAARIKGFTTELTEGTERTQGGGGLTAEARRRGGGRWLCGASAPLGWEGPLSVLRELRAVVILDLWSEWGGGKGSGLASAPRPPKSGETGRRFKPPMT